MMRRPISSTLSRCGTLEKIFVRIEGEDRQVFAFEESENFRTPIEEDTAKIAGRQNLLGDAFDILGECHVLLQSLKILRNGRGWH